MTDALEILQTGKSSSSHPMMLGIEARYALALLRQQYDDIAGYNYARMEDAIVYHKDKDGRPDLDRPLDAYVGFRKIYDDFENSPAMVEWYKEADNFMLFLNTQIDPAVAIVYVNFAIRESLPFSSLRMPNHKAFFAKNYMMFKGIDAV